MFGLLKRSNELPSDLISAIGRSYIFYRHRDGSEGGQSLLIGWGAPLIYTGKDQLQRLFINDFPELNRGQLEQAVSRMLKHLNRSSNNTENRYGEQARGWLHSWKD
jgi:hypothetical protein